MKTNADDWMMDRSEKQVICPSNGATEPGTTTRADWATVPSIFGKGRRYQSLSQYLKTRFGEPVQGITLDAGFTCPNVDGTITTGGCVYCDNRSFSPNRRLPRATITQQIDRGLEILQHRYGAKKFFAYFQAGTNTYGSLSKLKKLFDEAVHHPKIMGLAVGTRPDCVPDEVLDLLESYGEKGPVWLELGLQTIHDRSLEWMNRGHGVDAFFDAVDRCRNRRLELTTHVILGLPGESREDMLATADTLARLPIHSIKIHNLYVVRKTPLEKMYLAGEVPMMEMEDYAELVCDFLERVPPRCVIHRLAGDSPPDYLVAPLWCLDKQKLLRRIDEAFLKRDSWQGKHWREMGSHTENRPRRSRSSLPVIE